MQTKTIGVDAALARPVLDFSQPSESCWKAYENLWKHSQQVSAFQAPCFLKNLLENWPAQTAFFQYYRADELLGAVFLLRQNEQWQFLSNLKSDHNYFVLHQDCDPETQQSFFQHLLQACYEHRLQLVLDHFPENEQYRLLRMQLEKYRDMHWVDCAFSVCPLALADTPDQLFQMLTQSKRLRRNVRRLKGDKQVRIEFFQDSYDLDQWVQDYCQLHVQRWRHTSTPSRYENAGAVQALQVCLQAWIQDGILLRSAIVKDNHRISLNIGLLEKDTLIGHGQAYDPSYNSYSPGRTLLLLMAEWMRQKGIRKFDMGDGRDPYKTSFANDELLTRRLYIARRSHIFFFCKAYLYKFVRERPSLLGFYRNRIKPVLARF